MNRDEIIHLIMQQREYLTRPDGTCGHYYTDPIKVYDALVKANIIKPTEALTKDKNE